MRGVRCGRDRGGEVPDRRRRRFEKEDAAHRADGRCGLQVEVDLVRPAGVGARERRPAGLVGLGEAGCARGALQRRQGRQRAALQSWHPGHGVGPELGDVGERVHVVIGIDDRDHQRRVTNTSHAVGGPDARAVEVDRLGRRGGHLQRRFGPGSGLLPVEVEGASDGIAARLVRPWISADVRVLMAPARRLGGHGRRPDHRQQEEGRGDHRREPLAERDHSGALPSRSSRPRRPSSKERTHG